MRACRDVLQSYIKEDGWPGPERAKTNLFFWQSRGDLAAQDIVRRWQNDSSLDLRNPSLAKDVLMEYLKLHRLQLEGTVSVLN